MSKANCSVVSVQGNLDAVALSICLQFIRHLRYYGLSSIGLVINTTMLSTQKQVEQYLSDKLGVIPSFLMDKRQQLFTASFAYLSLWPEMKEQLGLEGWDFEQNIPSFNVKPPLKPHPKIKNVIAVASGKGGVGKSTTTVNLAYALKKLGAKVGILDADIYGPSVPLMLGLSDKQPEKNDDETLIPPLIKDDIQAISIGFLLEEQDAPTIWRGPMVSRALSQLFNHTAWEALDYLLIDMPPGTGDIALTLVQKLPVSGTVICTTPQDVALIDAKKAYRMFEKTEIPVLGLIENMSAFVCPHCGEESDIFGASGGEKLSASYKLDVLGSVPLSKELRLLADCGKIFELFNKENKIGKMYELIGAKIAARLSKQKKDYSKLFGRIAIS